MQNIERPLDSRVDDLEERMDKHLEVLNEISAKLDKLDNLDDGIGGILGELRGLRGDLNGGFGRLWKATGEYDKQLERMSTDLTDEAAETYRKEIADSDA